MRLILGPNDITQEGLGYIAHIFYDLGLLYVGLIIGVIIALLFVIIDGFIFKNKLKSFTTRLVVLLVISVCVIGFHYILEKVLDVI
jgi:NO-binding membrane sensor protein with MHYT domain